MLLWRIAGIDPYEIVRKILPVFFAVAATALVLWLSKDVISNVQSWVSLTAQIIISLVTYPVILFAIARGDLVQFLSDLYMFIPSKKATKPTSESI